MSGIRRWDMALKGAKSHLPAPRLRSKNDSPVSRLAINKSDEGN